MIHIIRANLENPDHAQALVDLMRIYALDPMGGGKDLSDYAKANLASALSKRDDTCVVLAFFNGEAVGLLTCMEGFSSFNCKPLINIHDVIVKPEFREQGILKRLLKEAEKIAVEKGCCKLTLEVLEGNGPARTAYGKFGFKGYELDPKMGKALFLEKLL